MLVGYANGYASSINGTEMLYKEVECTAMGAPCCRCIGRPAKDWAEDESHVRFYSVAELVPQGSRKTGSDASNTGSGSEPQIVVGVSPAFRAARDKLEKVAGIDATVLLEGESGVGKEMFTSTLHA
ncbi:RNA polymerase sigma factor 54, interaction domain protein, partial [mine drainage metagenome]